MILPTFKSFESVEYWIEQINALRADNPFICIVGNKADLEDQRWISSGTGKSYAQSVGATYMETSSKNIISIEQAFFIAIKQAYSVKIEKETEKILT